MTGFPGSPTIDIMVDIETLGNKHDTVILSIGACSFNDKDILSKFSVNISIPSQLPPRSIDPKTLEWWLTNNHKAIPALKAPWPVPIKKAMIEFCTWVTKTEHSYMWANGASFDFPILRHAIEESHIPIPWKYWEELCMRPVRRIGQNLSIDWKEFQTNESSDLAPHVGINDAIMQAEYIMAVMRKIDGPKVPDETHDG